MAAQVSAFGSPREVLSQLSTEEGGVWQTGRWSGSSRRGQEEQPQGEAEGPAVGRLVCEDSAQAAEGREGQPVVRVSKATEHRLDTMVNKKPPNVPCRKVTRPGLHLG